MIIGSNTGVYPSTVTVNYDCEFLSIAVAADVYNNEDFWDLDIEFSDGTIVNVCESIYIKHLPESVAMGNEFSIVYPVSGGTKFNFKYNNNSGKSKIVLYNLKLLK